MKARKTTSVSHLAHAVCLTSLVACSSVPKSEPTEEEREKIQEAMDVMDLVVELTEDVAELADPETLADARGGEGTVEEFQEGVRQAQDTAVRLWQDGRVFVFDTEDVLNPETSLIDNASGFYFTDAGGPFIALESDVSPSLVPRVLLHEGSHRQMGHTEAIDELNNNPGPLDTDRNRVRVAIASGDFPTQLSSLVVTAEMLLGDLMSLSGTDSELAYRELERLASESLWTEFDELVESYRLGEAPWPELEDRLDEEAMKKNGFDLYGIDHDRLLETIHGSRLYRYKQDIFLEQLEEMRLELREAYDAPPETSLEVQRGRGSRR